jgi:hypothetical protein
MLLSRTLFCWALLVCAAAPAAAQDASLVLARGRAGIIALGMPQDSIRRLVDRDHLMELTNCTEKGCLPALGIVRGSEPAVVAHLTDPQCAISRVAWLEVYDPAYRTREGVGVGTSRVILEQTYRTTVRASDQNELYAPAVGLGFRVSRTRGTGEARVEVVIVRDSASVQPTIPGCVAPTPPTRRQVHRTPSH